jgi:hypothetical protein
VIGPESCQPRRLSSLMRLATLPLPSRYLMAETHPIHRVFAYGSNMHLPDLARWMEEHGRPAPAVHKIIPALLEQHRLAWNYRSRARGAGAANAWPSPGQQLPGIILEVDAATFAAIDAKEGHPNRYCRGTTMEQLVGLDGDPLHAWVYRVTPALLRPEPQWPTRAYLKLIRTAARTHNLPQWHQDHLASLPTSG